MQHLSLHRFFQHYLLFQGFLDPFYVTGLFLLPLKISENRKEFFLVNSPLGNIKRGGDLNATC